MDFIWKGRNLTSSAIDGRKRALTVDHHGRHEAEFTHHIEKKKSQNERKSTIPCNGIAGFFCKQI